jgi:integrase
MALTDTEIRALKPKVARYLQSDGRGLSLDVLPRANALNKALEGLVFYMDPLTIHDLRRTTATMLTENNFDKDVIEKALNHTREGIRAV